MSHPASPLAGKAALATGSSRGLGFAIAEGRPDEPTGTAVHSAPAASNDVGGQIIHVDGGMVSVL